MWRRRLSAAIQEYEWTSISLSAFGRAWCNRAPVALVGPARVFAAFKVGRCDAPVDSCSWQCYALRSSVPDIAVADQDCRITVVAVSTGLWPVPVPAAGIFGIILFSATTASIYRPTSASAAILKRSGQKVHHWLALIISRARMHTHRQVSFFTFVDAIILFPCFFLFLFFLSFFSLCFSVSLLIFFSAQCIVCCLAGLATTRTAKLLVHTDLVSPS